MSKLIGRRPLLFPKPQALSIIHLPPFLPKNFNKNTKKSRHQRKNTEVATVDPPKKLAKSQNLQPLMYLPMFCLPKITSATIHKEKINCQKMFRHHHRHKWQFSNQPKMMPPKTSRQVAINQITLVSIKVALNLQGNFSPHQFLLTTPEMLPKPLLSRKFPFST